MGGGVACELLILTKFLVSKLKKIKKNPSVLALGMVLFYQYQLIYKEKEITV